MTDVDDLLGDMVPVASRLICAVADHDAGEVGEALAGLDTHQLHVLAVLLAANVPESAPLGEHPRVVLPPVRAREKAVKIAAQLFKTHPSAILSDTRYRNITDARAVAMAACRMVGQTSVEIGEWFGRDHTTVLHAAGRVGEDAKLRRIATAIADQIGDRSLFSARLEELA